MRIPALQRHATALVDLVAMGFPKFQGGLGGYARFIAICPPDWKYGVSVGQVPESPLARSSKPLHWDGKLGMRVR